jgi:hypothetical protein
MSKPGWVGVGMYVLLTILKIECTDRVTIKILSWFWPLASTPDRKSGLDFEVNEFEGTSPPIHDNQFYNANTV